VSAPRHGVATGRYVHRIREAFSKVFKRTPKPWTCTSSTTFATTSRGREAQGDGGQSRDLLVHRKAPRGASALGTTTSLPRTASWASCDNRGLDGDGLVPPSRTRGPWRRPSAHRARLGKDDVEDRRQRQVAARSCRGHGEAGHLRQAATMERPREEAGMAYKDISEGRRDDGTGRASPSRSRRCGDRQHQRLRVSRYSRAWNRPRPLASSISARSSAATLAEDLLSLFGPLFDRCHVNLYSSIRDHCLEHGVGSRRSGDTQTSPRGAKRLHPVKPRHPYDHPVLPLIRLLMIWTPFLMTAEGRPPSGRPKTRRSFTKVR